MYSIFKITTLIIVTIFIPLTLLTISGELVYSDKIVEEWYIKYLDDYNNSGININTNNSIFDPDAIVSNTDMLTACAKLHNVLTGGNGDIEAIYRDRPNSMIYFSDIDGNKVAGLSDIENIFESFDSGSWSSYFYFSNTKTDELRDSKNPIDSLVYNFIYVKHQYVLCYVNDGNYCGSYQLVFNDSNIDEIANYIEDHNYTNLYLPYENEKYFDSTHYYIFYYGYISDIYVSLQFLNKSDIEIYNILTTEYLNEIPSTITDKGSEPCIRAFFARNLIKFIPDEFLQPLRDFGPIPDLDAEVIRRLYNAGIMGGVDDIGTFDGHGVVTRAQLAAVIARILEPSLRLR